MKNLFSRLNIVLLFCNALLVLGIAYLWYPHVSDVRGGVTVVSVQNEVMSNEERVMVFDTIDIVESSLDGVASSSTAHNNVTIEQCSNEENCSSDGEQQPVELAVLPPEINLPVPFTSQAPEGNWDQPWQDACEEAAILMLDAYYKKYNLSPLFSKDEILKMVDWQTERGWGYSIPMTKVEQAAQAYMGDSFRLSTIENPTVEELKQSLAAGHPVLVVAYGKALGNPFFSGDGPEYHALIIRGYSEDGFITNDPGTKRGEAYVYDFDTLMNSIHDWNGGDVKSGKSVVLVVE